MQPWRHCVAAGLLLALSGAAAGAEFLCPETGGGLAALPEGRSARNLYVAGATVSLRGPVQGDLSAAGGKVEVGSPVQRALAALAGELRVEQSVGGSARLAAGRLWVDSLVGEDLIAAGGSLSLGSKAAVKGDAALAGGDVDLEGSIGGRAWIAGTRVILNGPIKGKVVVRYGESLTLGPSCRLAGTLECHGPKPPLLEKGALAPTVDFHASAGPRAGRFFGLMGLLGVLRFLGWVLAAWALTRLCARPLATLLAASAADPWRNLGTGLLILLAAALGIPLLLLTGVGYYSALLLAALLGAALLLCRLLAGFYAAQLLRGLARREPASTPAPFGWVAGGILAVQVLDLIPFLGWILSLALTLPALGALSKLAYERR